MNSRCAVVNLSRAIKLNDIETVRSLLVKYSEKVFYFKKCSDLPKDGFSPLWEAMILGHEKIVELLIDFGADVNEKFSLRFSSKKNNFDGLSFLHCLPHLDDYQSNIKIAEILIRRGANVNTVCEKNFLTPFENAIFTSNMDYAEFLLENGAKLQIGSREDPIFLIVAVTFSPKNRQTDMMRLLMKHGLKPAEIRHKKTGNDYLRLAIKFSTNRLEKIDVVGIAKILLESGVPVNGQDCNGTPTINYAIRSQSLELISLLIDNGADLNLKVGYDGVFPLYIAASLNNVEILDLLLSKGANVNNKNRFGSTALHEACNFRNEEAIKFLLQNGAHLSEVDQGGYTPLAVLEKKYGIDGILESIIREVAKQKFDNELTLSQKDVDLVRDADYFRNCTEELTKMSSTKFYACYTYFWVLKMSRNGRKKLANLTKNREFVVKFRENLDKFPCYQNDLKKIMEDAIKAKLESSIVEYRLRAAALGAYLPAVVIRILTDNLTIKDLPLQSADDKSPGKCVTGIMQDNNVSRNKKFFYPGQTKLQRFRWLNLVPKKHTCKPCGINYRFSSHLKKHIEVVHLNGFQSIVLIKNTLQKTFV